MRVRLGDWTWFGTVSQTRLYYIITAASTTARYLDKRLARRQGKRKLSELYSESEGRLFEQVEFIPHKWHNSRYTAHQLEPLGSSSLPKWDFTLSQS